MFNGIKYTEGAAKIYINKQWSSICTSRQTASVAKVICKSMHMAFQKKYYTPVFGYGITLSNSSVYMINCSGMESNIQNCEINKMNSSQQCTKSRQLIMDMSIVCTGM